MLAGFYWFAYCRLFWMRVHKKIVWKVRYAKKTANLSDISVDRYYYRLNLRFEDILFVVYDQ